MLNMNAGNSFSDLLAGNSY